MKKRVLVFPCGTEIGLTIWNSLRHTTNIELWGGSSADDHGRFAYRDNYIPDIVMVDHPGFLTDISIICDMYKIDYIYPAHDDVLVALAGVDFVEVLAPSAAVVQICRSKNLTYNKFPEISPRHSISTRPPLNYPVFMKPDRGQGSKDCVKANDKNEWTAANKAGMLTVEYLPGPEFTVDCFTDRHGELRFCEGRIRTRTKNGIAVRTQRAVNPEFRNIALFIMSRLEMRGQWFYQVKEDKDGELKLLEIAPRPAGSSMLWTAHNVYLPKLTVLDRMGEDVVIDFVEDEVEMDRALNHRFCYHRAAKC